ncbi:MAG: (Na+)-NQR maturation NqrM [Congregibacter sp.]
MIYLLSFLIMLLIVAGMAVGAMAGRGPLKGSCGGLAAVGIEGRCDICGDDPSLCDEQKRQGEPSGQGVVRTAEFYKLGN